ncbi:restriction endonuclease subunit S [Helicobacter zhangjianzhongii]|nr:restriction endonuclease subunit S [Helicobacter sp. CPD2-1]MDL0080022.1 restriction endonuclease subunit S [Helicobacter sp. CPD2-1]
MSKVQVVWFRDLKLWDLKSNLFDNEMFANSKFPLVQVSTFLHRNKTQIKIQNNETYKRVTIKTKGQGCHLRDTLKGSLIGTKNQFLIKEGQFLISKIDARNGAFGVVSQDIHNAIITGNFWTYDIDTSKVNAYFLALFTSTKYFIDFCKACSGGTTGRHYLDENKFLNAKIPLPPLEIQKQIVAKIQSIKAQIKALQEEEKRLKDEIEAYIYIALGLEKKQEAKRQKVFIVRFKDLDRWDTRHNQSIAINLCHTDSTPCHTDTTSTCHTNSPTHHSNPLSCHTEAIAEVSTNIESKFVIMSEANNLKKYNRDISPTAQYDNEMSRDISLPLNTTNLESLLDSIPTPPPHGWEVKTLGEICETNIGLVYTPANVSNDEKDIIVLRSNNIQNGKIVYDDLIRVKNIKISPNKIANKGDLLMCVRNGSANLIGKTAMIDRDGVSFGAFMAIIRSKYNKFLYHLLQCDYFRNYTTQSRTSGINQISQNDIKNFKIPLPPLSVQEKILAHIQKIESSIAATQEKAKALGLELTHYIESTL